MFQSIPLDSTTVNFANIYQEHNKTLEMYAENRQTHHFLGAHLKDLTADARYVVPLLLRDFLHSCLFRLTVKPPSSTSNTGLPAVTSSFTPADFARRTPGTSVSNNSDIAEAPYDWGILSDPNIGNAGADAQVEQQLFSNTDTSTRPDFIDSRSAMAPGVFNMSSLDSSTRYPSMLASSSQHTEFEFSAVDPTQPAPGGGMFYADSHLHWPGYQASQYYGK
jgi:hypothetical protein